MANDFVTTLRGDDKLSPVLKGAAQSVKGLSDSANDGQKMLDFYAKKFKDIESSGKPLKNQLRQLSQTMAQMNADGLTSTKVFTEMAQYAGSLSDAMGDAQQAIRQYSSDTAKLDAGIQAFQGIIGTVTAAQGAMAMFGIENDNIAKSIQKVQGAMAILNGVQQVANVLNKDSALMLQLKSMWHTREAVALAGATTATNTYTVAQRAATIAVKGFKAALISTGIGIALVAIGEAIGYVVEKWDEWFPPADKTIKKTKSALDGFNVKVSDTVGSSVGKFQILKNEWDKLRTTAEKNKWIDDNKNAFDSLGLSIDDLKGAEDVFVNNTSNVVKALEARAKAAAAQELLVDAYKDYYKQMDSINSVQGGGFKRTAKKGSALTDDEISHLEEKGFKKGVDFIDPMFGGAQLKDSKKAIDEIDKYRNQKALETQNKIKSNASKSLENIKKIALDAAEEANKASKEAGDAFTKSTKTPRGGLKNKTTKTPISNKKEEIIPDDGSLKALQNEANKLKAILDNASPDSEGWNDTLKRLRDVNASIEKINEKYKEQPTIIKGSLEELRKQKEELEKSLLKISPDDENVPRVMGQIEEIKKQIENTEIKLGIKPQMSKSDEYNKMVSQYSSLQNQFSNGLIDKAQFESELAQLSKLFDDFGAKNPIKVDMQVKSDQAKMQAANDVADIAGSIGSSLQSIGSNLDMPEFNVAGTIAQAIATMTQGYTTATAQAATMGPWAWIAFAAAGLAQLTAVIASLKSLNSSGSYASGGIIPGSSYHGDSILANVNAGEMILNRKQQSNLFRLLDNGGANQMNQSVTMRIKGQDLYAVLHNYESQRKKRL